jgi:hypothetical protein
LRAALVYHERIGGRDLAGVRYEGLTAETRDALLVGVFAKADTWQDAHAREARGHVRAASLFALALVRWLLPLRVRRRRQPRRRRFGWLRLVRHGAERRVLLRDTSPRGLGLFCVGAAPEVDGWWRLPGLDSGLDEAGWGRSVWVRRRFRWFWYVGIERLDAPQDLPDVVCELAA